MKAKKPKVYLVEFKADRGRPWIPSDRGIFLVRSEAVRAMRIWSIKGWRYRVTRYDSTKGK